MSTFVSVGNATQPFHRLLHSVSALSHKLPAPVFVQYGSAANFSCPGCDAVAFVDMPTFERQVADAELLILHAGAGSVIHAIKAGKVPVVMPRRAQFGEHVDDHQVEFAHELAAVGKVVMCEDAAKLAVAVAEALDRQCRKLNAAGEPALVGMIRAVLHDGGA